MTVDDLVNVQANHEAFIESISKPEVVESKPKPVTIGPPPIVEEVLAHPERYKLWRERYEAVLNG